MGSVMEAIAVEEREEAVIDTEEASYILDNVKIFSREITPEVYNLAKIRAVKAMKDNEAVKAALQEIDKEIDKNISKEEEYIKGRVDGLLYARHLLQRQF